MFFDLLYIVLQLLFNYNNIYIIVIKRLISPFYITNGPLWFLLCLFNAYLIFYFIKTYSKRFIHPNLLTFILVVIFSMGGFYLSRLHFHGLRIVPPFFLGASFTSLIFIYIGSFSKRFILQKNKYDYIFCLSFISIFILTEYLYGPFHIDFSWNEFSNNYFIIAFIGIIGSLMIIYISKLINYIPILNYIGRYSIIVLGSHLFFISILNRFNINPYLKLCILITLMCGCIYLIKKYFPRFCAQEPFFKIESE